MFNFSRRKVGGIWFIKIGRFNLSFSVSRPAPAATFEMVRRSNLEMFSRIANA